MNKADFDLGFEIIFNTQHGKNVMFLIMQEFLGGWQLEKEGGTCYDRHLNAIYDAIKAAKLGRTVSNEEQESIEGEDEDKGEENEGDIPPVGKRADPGAQGNDRSSGEGGSDGDNGKGGTDEQGNAKARIVELEEKEELTEEEEKELEELKSN
jgi:hypothetical protein